MLGGQLGFTYLLNNLVLHTSLKAYLIQICDSVKSDHHLSWNFTDTCEGLKPQLLNWWLNLQVPRVCWTLRIVKRYEPSKFLMKSNRKNSFSAISWGRNLCPLPRMMMLLCLGYEYGHNGKEWGLRGS